MEDKKLEELKLELDYKNKIIHSFLGLGQFIAKEQPDINRVLQHILKIVDEIMNIEASSILIIDEHINKLKFIAATGPKATQILNYKLKMGEGIAGKVIRSGEPIIILDTEKDKLMKKEITKEIDYHVSNLVCFPLKLQNRIFGVLEALNKVGNETFTTIDIELMQVMATQAAMLIENSLLMVKYQKQVTELNTFIQLLMKLSSTLDMNSLISKMMDEIKNLTNCESSSIILEDSETKDLFFYMVSDVKSDQIRKIKLPQGQGIAGKCIETGKSYIINEVEKDTSFYKEVDNQTGFVTRNLICAPIKIKGSVMGAVEAVNKKNGIDFNDSDLNILNGLGSQIGIGLTNAQIYSDLKNIFLQTVKALATAIDAKDTYTRGHSERVRHFSVLIAKACNLNKAEIEKIELAALLHDIGKIGIEDNILKKEGALDDNEFNRIKLHPEIGRDILKPITALSDIIDGVTYHHERWDGTGYPKGLQEKNIPLVGRIIAIADAYDAMTSDRPYRSSLKKKQAINELKKYSYSQFDGELVEAFLNVIT